MSQKDEWRDKLTPEQYRVLREGGTEPPFTGELLHCDVQGKFSCAACGNQLFHRIRNSIPVRAGRLSTALCRERSSIGVMLRTAWCALRFCARSAARTSAMFSTTVRPRRASATASIPSA